MNTTADITKPGIYPGVRFDDYRKVAALNMTTLLWGRCSMAHVKAAIDGRLEHDSDALAMGRAFHCRILEPDIYPQRVAVAGECCALLKSGDRKGEPCGKAGSIRSVGAWYCKTHSPGGGDAMDDVEVINTYDANAIEGMRASVMAHPIVGQIRRRGGFETTVVGEIDGELCKVRFDKLITEGRAVAIDLKKCRLGYAKPERVERSIYEYGYHVRAAFYRDVLAAAGGPKDCPFILVFVEDEYPYAVSCVEVGDAKSADGMSWIDVGRGEYRKLLASYKAAKASGSWPAYTDEDGSIDVRTSFPPTWVSNRHAGDLAPVDAVARHPDADIMW